MTKRTAYITAIFVVLLLSNGCTPIPVEYRQAVAQPASRMLMSGDTPRDEKLMAVVAAVPVGSSQLYADPHTGLTSTIKVNSEYFSANGRNCRRFSHHQSNAASPVKRLACKAQRGWQEIPVASIVE